MAVEAVGADLWAAPGDFRVCLVACDDAGGGWTNRYATEYAYRFGQAALARVLGARWPQALAAVRLRGILAVATIRMIPVVPFTFTNLAAGASSIRLSDFLLGTLLGSTPGLLLLSIMGDRVVAIASHPTWTDGAVLVLAILAYLGVVLLAQALVLRSRRR